MHQDAALALDDLVDLGAGIGRHHGEVGDQRIELDGEVDRALHRLARLAGQADDEEADRLQADFFGVLEGLADRVVVDVLVDA